MVVGVANHSHAAGPEAEVISGPDQQRLAAEVSARGFEPSGITLTQADLADFLAARDPKRAILVNGSCSMFVNDGPDPQVGSGGYSKRFEEPAQALLLRYNNQFRLQVIPLDPDANPVNFETLTFPQSNSTQNWGYHISGHAPTTESGHMNLHGSSNISPSTLREMSIHLTLSEDTSVTLLKQSPAAATAATEALTTFVSLSSEPVGSEIGRLLKNSLDSQPECLACDSLSGIKFAIGTRKWDGQRVLMAIFPDVPPGDVLRTIVDSNKVPMPSDLNSGVLSHFSRGDPAQGIYQGTVTAPTLSFPVTSLSQTIDVIRSLREAFGSPEGSLQRTESEEALRVHAQYNLHMARAKQVAAIHEVARAARRGEASVADVLQSISTTFGAEIQPGSLFDQSRLGTPGKLHAMMSSGQAFLAAMEPLSARPVGRTGGIGPKAAVGRIPFGGDYLLVEVSQPQVLPNSPIILSLSFPAGTARDLSFKLADLHPSNTFVDMMPLKSTNVEQAAKQNQPIVVSCSDIRDGLALLARTLI